MNLQLLNYKINKINYAINAPSSAKPKVFTIKPDITYKLKVEGEQIAVSAIFNLENKEGSNSPFDIYIEMMARFKVLSESSMDDYRVDINAQLFPYIRNTVSQVTLVSNIPAYNLPIINFSQLSSTVPTSGGRVSPPNSGPMVHSKNSDLVITPLEDL